MLSIGFARAMYSMPCFTFVYIVFFLQVALPDFQMFQKALRGKESHLYLGLDSPPSTPDIKDIEFDHPINGQVSFRAKTVGKNGTTHNRLQKIVDAEKKKSSTFLEPSSKNMLPNKKSPLKVKPPNLHMPKMLMKDVEVCVYHC